MRTRQPYAVGYCRFSPRPGADQCDSCDRQEQEIRDWCERNGVQLRAVCRDENRSGADDEREGLEEAIDTLKRGDLLLIRDLSRLARDNGMTERYMMRIAAKGARLRSLAGEGTLSETPEDEFMRVVFQAMHQYQRKANNRRTKRQMLRHQANGRRVSNRIPYGFMPGPDRQETVFNRMTMQPDVKTVRTLIENPEEQPLLQRIYAMHEAGRGPRAIARELMREGHKCRGGPWHHTTVRNILHRAGRTAPPEPVPAG